ncbi:MAG: AI-2E family transporter [Candidatus Saccharibacteria bacterium]|nr:AI-2E family transporter [Candidatus Saccharibacteria bacterium]
MSNHKLLILVAALALAFVLREVIIILFVAFLLTTAFLPVVQWLKQKRIPRGLSSIILIVALVVIPIALLFSVGPALADEGRELFNRAPKIVDEVDSLLSAEIGIEVRNRVVDRSEQMIADAFTATGSAVRVIIGIVLVPVLAVYWLTYYRQAKVGLINFIGAGEKGRRQFASDSFEAVEARLGSWVKGQLLVSFAVGLLTWVVLLILGVPYAGVLALIAAFLEIIPTLGPILAAVPALLIALTIDTSLFFIVLIAYVVIQQVESYIISPRVLGQSVKMNPFAVLLSVIVGTNLLGIIGALLAVPAVITGQEIYRVYVKERDKLQT